MTDNDRRSSDPRIDQILVVIEGTPQHNALGEPIRYMGGMRQSIERHGEQLAVQGRQLARIGTDVNELKDIVNGGGRFSLKSKDKAQLIGFMTLIIVALERASQLL